MKYLEQRLPEISFSLRPTCSPGDRDRRTPLENTPPDFFCRDLDEALLAKKIDCAIHSAKDLPEASPAGIDRFWLPDGECRNDAIVLPINTALHPGGDNNNGEFRIGVSSERRAQYCRNCFPNAELAPIRGNIEMRLEQLDRGDFNMLIMAAAALHRLGLHNRIAEYIPLAELPVPEGQGRLAVTFRQGDERFIVLRNLLLYPVQIAGAGIGTPENATAAVIDALKNCELCIHDSLLPDKLLELVPDNAKKIAVGKRSGQHSAAQSEICLLLVKYAKQGRRVLRLKGGDPTVFGRLAEEVEALQAESLPFTVLPGVGAISVAAATTGILPSRRDTARGFSVMTPRKAGSGQFEPLYPTERLQLPQICYMATKTVDRLATQYIDEGLDPNTPMALVLDAGGATEEVSHGTLESFRQAPPANPAKKPGLLFIGDIADAKHRFHTHAPLENKTILYCGATGDGLLKAKQATRRFGGRMIAMPMTTLELATNTEKIIATLTKFDYLLITSPACAKLLVQACMKNNCDLRRIPKLIVCGRETAKAFEQHGIFPEIVPQQNFGTDGLLAELEKLDVKNKKILRLRSNLATNILTKRLQNAGALVDDREFYRSQPLNYEEMPDTATATAVVFTSASAVRSFIENFGAYKLTETMTCAIGEPTAAALKNAGIKQPLIAFDATIAACIETVAAMLVTQKIKNQKN